jgi:hypothetical protein
MLVQIQISPGELFDRITILQIKKNYAAGDPDKLNNISHELEMLLSVAPPMENVSQLIVELRNVNHNIWVVEEGLRHFEKFNNFGPAFIALARLAYLNNNQRFRIKTQLNKIFDSELVEEKIYGV